MDFNQFEQLGEELRSAGHKRRQLVEQIFQDVNDGDLQSSRNLYRELSNISDQAIQIIDRQKQLLDEEVQKM